MRKDNDPRPPVEWDDERNREAQLLLEECIDRLITGDDLDLEALVAEHPITGPEVVLQLRGTAGERQLRDVEVGLAQSWRGIPTASGAVAVLGRE